METILLENPNLALSRISDLDFKRTDSTFIGNTVSEKLRGTAVLKLREDGCREGMCKDWYNSTTSHAVLVTGYGLYVIPCSNISNEQKHNDYATKIVQFILFESVAFQPVGKRLREEETGRGNRYWVLGWVVLSISVTNCAITAWMWKRGLVSLNFHIN